jgi:hypothetical protein
MISIQQYRNPLYENIEIHFPSRVKVNVNVKIKSLYFLTENHPIKAYWGSRGTAPRILDLGTRWR